MAAKALPSQEVLRQLLDYCPETGILTWKTRGAEWFPAKTHGRSLALCGLWNERYAGTRAFTSVCDGYYSGSLLGRPVKAHRVAWKMATGHDAEAIDHINGDRSDNRLLNFRSVSVAENSRNRKIPSNNKSGLLGIHRWAHGENSYWVVTAPRPEKSKYFKCLGRAIAERASVLEKHGFHENHGRLT